MNFNYSNVFITIATENIQLLTDFYSQILQKKPDVYRPDIYAEFILKELRLAIFKPKLERSQEFANVGSSMSFCIEVEDLEKAIATFRDLGCTPPGEIIEASHGKEIYAYDPMGNRLILHQGKNNHK